MNSGMFDPTAFDNVKVVLEGALYDLDIAGELYIIDRNEFLNVAKLSRQLELTLKKDKQSKISCTIFLRADITNLAAELHPQLQSEKEAGCHFKMVYSILDLHSFDKSFIDTLQAIWGNERDVRCKVSYNPLNNDSMVTVDIEVLFKRLIYEDQMEDLPNLAEYILQSIVDLGRVVQ